MKISWIPYLTFINLPWPTPETSLLGSCLTLKTCTSLYNFNSILPLILYIRAFCQVDDNDDDDDDDDDDGDGDDDDDDDDAL